MSNYPETSESNETGITGETTHALRRNKMKKSDTPKVTKRVAALAKSSKKYKVDSSSKIKLGSVV